METEKTIEPPIFRLPVEILQEIFRKAIHSSGPIRHLRLTCRHWRDLIAADRLLPRRIALRCGDDCRALHYPSQNQWDHCVHDAGQLMRALECIQQVQFHFHVTISKPMSLEAWGIVPWHQFATQCTGLFISPFSPNIHQTLTSLLGRLPFLHQLEELAMVGNSIIFSSSFPLSQQPTSIRSSSLRPLKLSWASERNLTIDLNPSRLFLNRVTIFELFHQGSIASVNILVTLFSSLCMLEEFTWTGSIGHPQDLRQIRESVNRRLKLRVLSIGMTMLPLFPSFSLTDLVILTVTSTTSDEKEGSLEEEYKLIHLPRLKELIERGSWCGLRHIEAPSLQRLRLLGYDGKSENVAQMKLDPAFVEIHDGGTGKIIEALVKRASSLNFTELHICHPCSSVYEDGRLAEIFSPDRAQSSSLLFPRLRHLLVELRPKHPDIPRPDNEKCKELTEASFNGFPYLVTVR